MQSVSSRIWTRVAVFISYDDNNYTTGTCLIIAHIFRFVCIDMEANACDGSFQTMQ